MLTALSLDLIHLLPSFPMRIFVELPAYAAFVFVLVGSLIFLPWGLWHGQRWSAVLPLTIGLVTIAALLLIPFKELGITRDFQVYHAQRERVVADVVSGVLQPNVLHNDRVIHLPTSYGSVSEGGNDIVVDREGEVLRVMFFINRGVIDNYSGFVYCADGIAPTNETLGGQIVEIDQYDPHWFWVSVT